MSYIAWRKDNEDYVMSKINDGELHTLPAWKESAFSRLTDTVIEPVVDEIVEKPLAVPIIFACAFAEYLFEEYHVSPADIELFSQTIIKSELRYVTNMAPIYLKPGISIIANRIKECVSEDAWNEVKDVLDEISEFMESGGTK